MNLSDEQCIEDLGDLLYNFLPGSGNSRTSFPIAASKAQVEEYWIAGSKRPSLVQLLSSTFSERSHKFSPLILAIVRQSMTWRRGKNDPLTRMEIDNLNKILVRLSLKIPELNEDAFLDSLYVGKTQPEEQVPPPIATLTDEIAGILSKRLLGLFDLPAQKRGYEYEKFLTELFTAYNLAPR